MDMNRWRIVACALTAAVSGCAGVPVLDTTSDLTVAHIVDQIQCELARSHHKHKRLKTEQWIAVADLTLQVEDSIGAAPKVSFIHPLAAGGSFAFGAGAELKRARQRIYTETLEMAISKTKLSSCATPKDDFDLTGDLGIISAIDIGLSSYDKKDAVKFSLGNDDPAFGQTIEFAVTKNVSGVGPTWTLARFTGPEGFFGAERIDTHKLAISFVQPAPPEKDGAAGPSVRAVGGRAQRRPSGALDRAYMMNQRMLLQSLPAFRRR